MYWAIASLLKVCSSMARQNWHQGATIDRRTGLFCIWASVKASSLHARHAIWVMLGVSSVREKDEIGLRRREAQREGLPLPPQYTARRVARASANSLHGMNFRRVSASASG